MSKNKAQSYAAFFEPLVGTPEAVDGFHTRLTRFVRYRRNLGGHDPYGSLGDILNLVVDEYVSRIHTAQGWSLAVEHRGRNMKVGGVMLTVNSLRAVGGLYEQHARDERGRPIPQRRSGVDRNTAHALGFLLSLANRSRTASTISIFAAQDGADPRTLRNRVLYTSRLIEGGHAWGEDLEGAFVATLDHEGQMRLSLRYAPLRTPSKDHCPALDERTPTGDRSLWEYLRVVGRVATDEIFPYQFSVVHDVDFPESRCPVNPVVSER